MRAFLKLSIAAVAIALFVSGTAFAGTVENGSDSKVSVNGIIWTGIGYVSGFDTNAAGDKPTSSFDINNETRLNVAWTSGAFTGHWEYWMRNDLGRAHNVIGGPPGVDAANDASGDEIMGWLTWKPSESIQLDVGQLEDQSWMERSVDWEMHVGTRFMPGATPGAYMGFPEDTPGLDVTFKAGEISAGVAVYAKGIVSGASNDQSTNSASTYVAHVEYTSGFMWIAAYLESESVSTAGTTCTKGANADGTCVDDATATDWGSTTDTSNTLIGISTRFNLGVGTLKVQYLAPSGDNYKPSGDAPSDIAFAYMHNLGEDIAAIEYDMEANGGHDDKGKLATATWLRISYKMAMGKNNNLQFLYDMSNDGNSTATRPGAAWITSF